MNLMTKKAFDVICLFYTKCATGVLQLDGTNFKTLGVVKRYAYEAA